MKPYDSKPPMDVTESEEHPATEPKDADDRISCSFDEQFFEPWSYNPVTFRFCSNFRPWLRILSVLTVGTC